MPKVRGDRAKYRPQHGAGTAQGGLAGSEGKQWIDPFDREITSATSLDDVSTGLSNNRSLRLLSLEHYDFERTRLDLMSPFLANNCNLCDLRVANCNLRLQDIQLLGDALCGRSKPIKLLSLSKNEINDVLMGGIVEVCNRCPGLKTLCLDKCGIGPSSGRHLGALLANPESELECLRLNDNPIGDEGAYRISGALLSNKKLKKLHLNMCVGISAQGWLKFIKILISYESLHETFGSRNHTLEDIQGAGSVLDRIDDGILHYGDPLDDDLLQDLVFCLFANIDANKNSAASKKIERYHMSEDLFDIAPFKEANLAVLPRVLEWISRYCMDREEWTKRSSSYYHVLQNFPELCGFPSREKRIALKLEAENASLKQKIEQLKRENKELNSNKRRRF